MSESIFPNGAFLFRSGENHKGGHLVSKGIRQANYAGKKILEALGYKNKRDARKTKELFENSLWADSDLYRSCEFLEQIYNQIKETLGWTKKDIYHHYDTRHRLFESDTSKDTLTELFSEEGPKYNLLVLVGHEPSLTEMARYCREEVFNLRPASKEKLEHGRGYYISFREKEVKRI